jgi:hypothetical protein
MPEQLHDLFTSDVYRSSSICSLIRLSLSLLFLIILVGLTLLFVFFLVVVFVVIIGEFEGDLNSTEVA